MEDSQVWRRLLVTGLLEAAYRFALLARLLESPVPPAFATLSLKRSEWAGHILGDFPDDDLASTFGAKDADESTADEVVLEETTAASEQGLAFACDFSIARERTLRDLVDDMTDPELPEPTRRQLRADLSAGIALLHRIAEEVRMTEGVINFSTKSAGTGRRAGPQKVIDVWFGTNRVPVMADGALVGFSGETADRTTLGRCGVTIPRTHRIGETAPSWWRRIVLRHEAMSLESVVGLQVNDFWTEVRARTAEAGLEPGDAIVFLHGYNVSFEDAAIRAAQIGADLNIPGATAFFSWPSRARTHAYMADEETIGASEKAITAFLEQFVANSGARRVHLIAHSMGNRGLLRAVDRIAGKATQSTGKPFGQIILAAPDVDRRTFAMLAEAYPKVGSRTTLYVSGKDLAVRSSRIVHAADRVGFAPPVTIQPGIDTISVSKVDLSFLGHGYVAGCRTVLTDIHQLITSEVAPERRAGMTSVAGKDGRYWELAA